jgi:integrase
MPGARRIAMSVAQRTWTTKSGDHTAWVVRYDDADGKQRQKTFKRKRDADAWEAQTKVDLRKGIHRPDSTSVTVAEAGKLWLDRCKAEELEPRAIVGYQSHLLLHIVPAEVSQGIPNGWSGKLGEVRLSRLTTPQCEAFKDYVLAIPLRNRLHQILAGKTISRAMARHIFFSFKAILKDAQRRGLIAFNPAQPIRLDPKRRERAPIGIGEEIPDRPDVRAILTAAIGRWYTIILTAAFTGLRSSELRGLVWPNIDLERQLIEVRQRADEKAQIGPCKSQSGYRTIPIGYDLVEELRRWKLICPTGPLNLVFPDDRGNVLHVGAVYEQLCAIQHRITMERPDGKAKYTVHGLRHFFASIMIDEGTPPKRLQQLLGHATLAMTTDTYGHLFPAGEAEANRINSAVASVLTSGVRAGPSVLDANGAKTTALSLSATELNRTAESPDRECGHAEPLLHLDPASDQRRIFNGVLRHAAITGALSTTMLCDPGRAIKAAHRTAELLNLLDPEGERLWRGEFVAGEGLVFTRTRQGIAERYLIDAGTMRSSDARCLEAAASQAVPQRLDATAEARLEDDP